GAPPDRAFARWTRSNERCDPADRTGTGTSGRARVGLSYRSIRAAGSALLVALAVGTGGMTGMASALAVDPVTVPLAGSVVDGSGTPLGGVDLTIVEELPPDGGIAAFPLTTAADGTFGADLYAWGTAAAPVTITIKTAPDTQVEVIGDTCSQTWSVDVTDL